jgi:hypothetical protein
MLRCTMQAARHTIAAITGFVGKKASALCCEDWPESSPRGNTNAIGLGQSRYAQSRHTVFARGATALATNVSVVLTNTSF